MATFKKKIASIFDFILFGNVFIALCAMSQGLVTFHLLNVPPQKAILSILFAATLAVYNFGFLIKIPQHPERSVVKRVRWFYSNYNLMLTLSLIALISLIPALFFLSFPSKILLLLLAILSFGYGLPFLKGQRRKHGLRNLTGFKSLLISVVWTLGCVLFPVLETNYKFPTALSTADYTQLLLTRFLFFGALTIAFDIRDEHSDRVHGLTTIPVALGKKNAYRICIGLLAADIMLLCYFRESDKNFIALTLNVIITCIAILYTIWNKNEYYYFFCLDGTMILTYLLLILFNLR